MSLTAQVTLPINWLTPLLKSQSTSRTLLLHALNEIATKEGEEQAALWKQARELPFTPGSLVQWFENYTSSQRLNVPLAMLILSHPQLSTGHRVRLIAHLMQNHGTTLTGHQLAFVLTELLNYPGVKAESIFTFALKNNLGKAYRPILAWQLVPNKRLKEAILSGFHSSTDLALFREYKLISESETPYRSI